MVEGKGRQGGETGADTYGQVGIDRSEQTEIGNNMGEGEGG